MSYLKRDSRKDFAMAKKDDLETLKIGLMTVLNNQGIIISALATIASQPMSGELLEQAKMILDVVEKDTLKLKV
jgi:hypothetical protein